jgi:hypothetical protein
LRVSGWSDCCGSRGACAGGASSQPRTRFTASASSSPRPINAVQRRPTALGLARDFTALCPLLAIAPAILTSPEGQLRRLSSRVVLSRISGPCISHVQTSPPVCSFLTFAAARLQEAPSASIPMRTLTLRHQANARITQRMALRGPDEVKPLLCACPHPGGRVTQFDRLLQRLDSFA